MARFYNSAIDWVELGQEMYHIIIWYTEGSGLGLSIAKSLTELQGGKFEISIDGDLFKVVMEW